MSCEYLAMEGEEEGGGGKRREEGGEIERGRRERLKN